MGLASALSATVEGVAAHMVTVEANVGPGLPGMQMVGLGDAAVKESRERIRTAFANAGLPWPRTRIMVSLSPAHLPKAGSHFDLPIALTVLGSIDDRLHPRLLRTMLMGELALDGTLRRVEGILPMLLAAKDARDRGDAAFDAIVVPRANAQEAALVGDRAILIADSLPQVYSWLHDGCSLDAAATVDTQSAPAPSVPDFGDIAGQSHERLAMEVAATGGHHVFMVGPPGSGKSMLAERLPGILPEMSLAEQIETTALHTAAGIARGGVVRGRPYVAPHPSISKAGLIGGGSGVPLPGAVSQAHNGVLFLDEASEISPGVLDALRLPLESGRVTLPRGKRQVTYPAQFQLVMAANPCKCGKEIGACTCPPSVRARHLSNVSGPLLDRLDIVMATTTQSAVLSPRGAEPSRAIAQRVAEAQQRAAARWQRAGLDVMLNARVPSPVLRRQFAPGVDASAQLEHLLREGRLTQRGVDRVLKLAWTLADLAGDDVPHIDHIDDALALRAADTVGVRA